MVEGTAAGRFARTAVRTVIVAASAGVDRSRRYAAPRVDHAAAPTRVGAWDPGDASPGPTTGAAPRHPTCSPCGVASSCAPMSLSPSGGRSRRRRNPQRVEGFPRTPRGLSEWRNRRHGRSPAITGVAAAASTRAERTSSSNTWEKTRLCSRSTWRKNKKPQQIHRSSPMSGTLSSACRSSSHLG